MELVTHISFFSNEESSASIIDNIKIVLTAEDKTNIIKAVELINDNKFIEQIRVSVNGEVTFFDDEDNKVNDIWKTDVIQFIVFSDIFVLYAQNKWHSGDQIESDSFSIDVLK